MSFGRSCNFALPRLSRAHRLQITGGRDWTKGRMGTYAMSPGNLAKVLVNHAWEQKPLARRGIAAETQENLGIHITSKQRSSLSLSLWLSGLSGSSLEFFVPACVPSTAAWPCGHAHPTCNGQIDCSRKYKLT